MSGCGMGKGKRVKEVVGGARGMYFSYAARVRRMGFAACNSDRVPL